MDKKDGVPDKALAQRMFEMVGAIKMADANVKFINAAKYSLLKRIKDSKIYRQLGEGMDWENFCVEILERDHKTIDTEIKLLEEFGEYFMKAVERLHLTKRDLLLLDKGLSGDVKAEVKKGVVKIGEREFKVSEIEENIDDFTESLEWLKKNREIAEKEKHLFEKEIKHQQKKEVEQLQKIEGLEKKVSALEPPATEEGRKQKFLEQTELVFRYLADAGKLMNHTMDFSIILKDRDCAVKYRGAVKVLSTLAQNLENKIGEVD